MTQLSLISLNLHCLEEENIEDNQDIIVDQIIQLDADVVFLQEVAQYADEKLIISQIKESNYGYILQELLNKRGKKYYYEYAAIKHSFNKYDEGVGILSKYPMTNTEAEYISKTQDYENWRSRKYLKATIQVNHKNIDLVTTHLGWDSRVESYLAQCENLRKQLSRDFTIIGGDFNVACGSEYYEETLSMGFIDLYGKNEDKKYDYTFENTLDVHTKSARIDYIFALNDYKVIEQEILFKNPKVSDHYGLYIKIEV